MIQADWNPNLYSEFAGLRLRPALDLMMRIGALPPGGVVDLGCGAGAVGPVLKARFRDRRLSGVDASPAMLERARATGVYDMLEQADAARWVPTLPPALIFSNALLHWLPDHDTLLPTLAGGLAPGGTLAVQVPYQNAAPSHHTWHDLVAQHFPGRFDPGDAPGILDATAYHRILSPYGRVDVWETEYLQVLPASRTAHPVRQFTSSTYARPVLATLNATEAAQLCALYDEAMMRAYPPNEDGSVMFSFRRLFFKLDIL